MIIGPDSHRLVVFGCSLTKDNYIDTWADILGKTLCLPLCNHAERGAGYNYILQKIFSVNLLSTDIVVIMWPSADRYDLYVNAATPHLKKDIKYASWLDGQTPALIDYQGNYNQHSGWLINGAVPRGYKHKYYKYFYTQTAHVNHAWATILSAQNYLSNKHVPYLMCNSNPLLSLIQYHDDGVEDFNYQLFNQIDLDKFVDKASTHGFINLVRSNGFEFFNPYYPNTNGHQWYVDTYLMPKIKL